MINESAGRASEDGRLSQVVLLLQNRYHVPFCIFSYATQMLLLRLQA